MNIWEKHGPVLPDKLLEPFIGSQIAEGSSRVAYSYRTAPGFVIKRGKTSPPIENIIEWSIWRSLRQSSFSECLGRIFAISESGRLLIMEKLDSITLEDYAMTPDIPPWLADVKPDMFGKDALGLLKVRDYGSLKHDVSVLTRKNWQQN